MALKKDTFMEGIKNSILQTEDEWFKLEYEPQVFFYITGQGCNIPEPEEAKTTNCGDAYLELNGKTLVSYKLLFQTIIDTVQQMASNEKYPNMRGLKIMLYIDVCYSGNAALYLKSKEFA